MEAKNEIQLKIRFADIKVVKFSQSDISLITHEIEKQSVEYTTNVTYNIFEEDERIVCVLNIIVKLAKTKEELAELTVNIEFDVSPLGEVMITEGSDKRIKTEVLSHLTSISASTVRGIIFERFKGSTLQSQIYPLFNVSNLFKTN